MSVSVTRRAALIGAAFLVPVLHAQAIAPATPDDRVAELERRHGGRLGVAALDTGSGRRLSYRADERFALSSTFKFLAAAAVLERVDRGQEQLDRRVTYTERDVLEYAPVTKEHVKDGGMTLSDLCAAAIEWSDNTAGNLLLQTIGGPAGLTQYARSLGDTVTRLDRTEPSLNDVKPGEISDTTSPAAMLKLMSVILCGKALSDDTRRHMEDWLVGAKTGQNRIPSGLPSTWRIGHKTGTGARAETNDIAILWPPDRSPILVAAYYTDSPAPPEARIAALGDLGRIIAETF